MNAANETLTGWTFLIATVSVFIAYLGADTFNEGWRQSRVMMFGKSFGWGAVLAISLEATFIILIVAGIYCFWLRRQGWKKTSHWIAGIAIGLFVLKLAYSAYIVGRS